VFLVTVLHDKMLDTSAIDKISIYILSTQCLLTCPEVLERYRRISTFLHHIRHQWCEYIVGNSDIFLFAFQTTKLYLQSESMVASQRPYPCNGICQD